MHHILNKQTNKKQHYQRSAWQHGTIQIGRLFPTFDTLISETFFSFRIQSEISLHSVAFSHPIFPSFLFLAIPQSCLVSHDCDYFQTYWSLFYTISLNSYLSDVSLWLDLGYRILEDTTGWHGPSSHLIVISHDFNMTFTGEITMIT